MAFEIRHAPRTDFNIADEYFTALNTQMRQRERNALAQADIDQRADAAAATDARAAERLAFDREQANLRQLAQDQKRRTEEQDANLIVDAYGPAIEDLQPEDIDPDFAAANRLQEDLFGAADRPLVEQETQGELDTPYGVKIPIVRPRSMAGARLLLDALNYNLDRKAKEEEARRKKAEKATQAGQDRERAARLQRLTGIGLPRPGGKRMATAEEGGFLLQDPTIQEPDDPGIQFDRPEDVLAVARLKQGEDRIAIAQQRLEATEQKKAAGQVLSEEDLDQAAADLMTIRPDLTPTRAIALARSRMNKIPVAMDNIKAKGPTETEEYKQLVHDRNATYTAVRRLQASDRPASQKKAELEVLQGELKALDEQLTKIRSSANSPASGGNDVRARLIQELEEGL
jgi:hypothetical protein